MLQQRELIECGGIKRARHRLGKYTRFRELRKFDMVRAIVLWLAKAGLVTLPSGKAGATDRGMNKNAYRGHRFLPAIIQVTVWMYARFTLSLRDVEELLTERGLDISYETVRRWFLKFGQVYARSVRLGRHRPTDHWYLDGQCQRNPRLSAWPQLRSVLTCPATRSAISKPPPRLSVLR